MSKPTKKEIFATVDEMLQHSNTDIDVFDESQLNVYDDSNKNNVIIPTKTQKESDVSFADAFKLSAYTGGFTGIADTINKGVSAVKDVPLIGDIASDAQLLLRTTGQIVSGNFDDPAQKAKEEIDWEEQQRVAKEQNVFSNGKEKDAFYLETLKRYNIHQKDLEPFEDGIWSSDDKISMEEKILLAKYHKDQNERTAWYKSLPAAILTDPTSYAAPVLAVKGAQLIGGSAKLATALANAPKAATYVGAGVAEVAADATLTKAFSKEDYSKNRALGVFVGGMLGGGMYYNSAIAKTNKMQYLDDLQKSFNDIEQSIKDGTFNPDNLGSFRPEDYTALDPNYTHFVNDALDNHEFSGIYSNIEKDLADDGVDNVVSNVADNVPPQVPPQEGFDASNVFKQVDQKELDQSRITGQQTRESIQKKASDITENLNAGKQINKGSQTASEAAQTATPKPQPGKVKATKDDIEYLYKRAKDNGVNPQLAINLIGQESKFTHIIPSGLLNSPAGAKGISQFMDKTWDAVAKKFKKQFGRLPDRMSIQDNFDMTVRLLSDSKDYLIKQASKDPILAKAFQDPEALEMYMVASYNAGTGSISKNNGVIGIIRRAAADGVDVSDWNAVANHAKVWKSKSAIAKGSTKGVFFETGDYMQKIGLNNKEIKSFAQKVEDPLTQKAKNFTADEFYDEVVKNSDELDALFKEEGAFKRGVRTMTGNGLGLGFGFFKKSLAAAADSSNNKYFKTIGNMIAGTSSGTLTGKMGMFVNTNNAIKANLRTKYTETVFPNAQKLLDEYGSVLKFRKFNEETLGELLHKSRNEFDNVVSKSGKTVSDTRLADEILLKNMKDMGLSQAERSYAFAHVNMYRKMSTYLDDVASKSINKFGIYMPRRISKTAQEVAIKNGTYEKFVNNAQQQIGEYFLKGKSLATTLDGVGVDLAKTITRAKLDGLSVKEAASVRNMLDGLVNNGSLKNDVVDEIKSYLDIALDESSKASFRKKSFNLDLYRNIDGVQLKDIYRKDAGNLSVEYMDGMAGELTMKAHGTSQNKVISTINRFLDEGKISREEADMLLKGMDYYKGRSMYDVDKGFLTEKADQILTFFSTWASAAFLGSSNLSAGGDLAIAGFKTMTEKSRKFISDELDKSLPGDALAIGKGMAEGHEFNKLLDINIYGSKNTIRMREEGAMSQGTELLQDFTSLQSNLQGERWTFDYARKKSFSVGLGSLEEHALGNPSILSKHIAKRWGVTPDDFAKYSAVLKKNGWDQLPPDTIRAQTINLADPAERAIISKFIGISDSFAHFTLQRSSSGQTSPVFQTGAGKIMFKFLSFMSDAWDRRLVHELYHGDMHSLGTFMFGQMGAMMSIVAKMKLQDMKYNKTSNQKDDEDYNKWEPERIFVEAVNLNPVFALASPVFSIADPGSMLAHALKKSNSEYLESFDTYQKRDKNMIDLKRSPALSVPRSIIESTGKTITSAKEGDYAKAISDASSIATPGQNFYPWVIGKSLVKNNVDQDLKEDMSDSINATVRHFEEFLDE